jgi:HD-like signal output (HDOD) protein
VSRAESERVPLEILEAEHFGFDHIEAGDWLAREWKLPADLRSVLFAGRLPDGPNSRLALLIRDAGEEAGRLGFGVLNSPPADSADPVVFEIAERVNQIEQGLGI